MCLSMESVCNNQPDCDDDTDEGPLCYSNGCDDHVCSHDCHETPSGPLCVCDQGFVLEDDLETCKGTTVAVYRAQTLIIPRSGVDG